MLFNEIHRVPGSAVYTLQPIPLRYFLRPMANITGASRCRSPPQVRRFSTAFKFLIGTETVSPNPFRTSVETSTEFGRPQSPCKWALENNNYLDAKQLAARSRQSYDHLEPSSHAPRGLPVLKSLTCPRCSIRTNCTLGEFEW